MFKNIQKKIGITKENETNIVEALHEMPKKEKTRQTPHYKLGGAEPGHVYQADLLYLPKDKGYEYLLVCVDTITGITDAVPVKHHDAADVKAGFVKMFVAGRPLQMPKYSIQMDPGGEFKAEVKQYFEDNNVFVRYGKVGRSRQQAMAENRNKIIAKALFQAQVGKEIQDGEVNKDWVDDVPKVIKAINEYETEKYKKEKAKRDRQDAKRPPVPKLDKKEPILEVGTKVRVALDKPENVFGDKQAGTAFRATDIRWKPAVRKITNIILTPRQPVMYQVDDELTGYTRQRLQVVSDAEMGPNVAPREVRDAGKVIEPPAVVVEKPKSVKAVDEIVEEAIKTRSGRESKKKQKLDL